MFNVRRYQETISLIFYKHGLACSTHPFAYILGVIAAFLIVCYPLTKMPFQGNAPLQFITPIDKYEVPSSHVDLENPEMPDPQVPRWYFDKPVSYIQQIVVKSASRPHLSRLESIKLSLRSMFDLWQHIDAFNLQGSGETLTMRDLCFKVGESITAGKKGIEYILPYGCLSLSPTRLWGHDISMFLQDGDVLSTIFDKGKDSEYFTSIRDVLFGVPGISKRNFLKLGEKPLVFAFTFALKEYRPRFLKALHEHLLTFYPLKIASSKINISVESTSSYHQKVDHLVHIHYQNSNFFVEYIPLIFAYVVLCLYLYFSVRKIEMVKSKWGLALSAMMTVIASLFMSLSLCVFVGLTPSLNGSEIFPYLVVIIGLENILVITKSVVSTPVHLDVKLRIALGLQKEGWYIFKNLITELFILAIGFLSFVPAIQEFCLFAILGLGSDFFLQIFFFTTVLSVDIRRMELSDLQGSRTSSHGLIMQNDTASSSRPSSFYSPATICSSSSSSLSSFYDGPDDEDEKIPKRVRLMHIWARYRVLQRAIMVFVLLWIVLVVCKTTIFDEDLTMVPNDLESNTFELPKFFRNFNNISSALLSDKKAFLDSPFRSSFLLHDDLELWKQLPFNHWKNLFDLYNISLVGRYLTILPSIHLSLGTLENKAPSSDITQIRQKFWKKFDNYPSANLGHNPTISFISKLIRYPRSNAELVLTILLGIFSLVLIICCVFLLYKCLCTRKYAKWRSYWGRKSYYLGKQYHKKYHRLIRESTPLVLTGHDQEIECICKDGRLLASSCLGGEVRIWDSETGECLSTIDRRCRIKYRPEIAATPRSLSCNVQGNTISDHHLNHSSVSTIEVEFFSKKSSRMQSRALDTTLASIIPDLTEAIDTNFTNQARMREMNTELANQESAHSMGFDFATKYKPLFDEHKKRNEVRERMREMRKRKEEEETKRRLVNAYGENTFLEADDDMLSGSAIWCLSFRNNLAILGCGGGGIEFWDIQSQKLMCFNQQSCSGVTEICPVENRIAAARVDGTLDFFALQQIPHKYGNDDPSTQDAEYTLQCTHLWSTRAHQMSINCLETDGIRIVTASQDHNLKVYRIEDHVCLFTLIGHTGGVTNLIVDKTAGLVISGSEDHSLRLWETKTGLSLHKLEGHQSAITGLAYDNMINRLFSVAMDDRLCVWDASRGHLLHCIEMDAGSCNTVSVLSHQFILTGGLGCIHLWEVETCAMVRSLSLSDHVSSVRQMISSDNGLVVTDYGNQLRIIKFNSVLEKHD